MRTLGHILAAEGSLTPWWERHRLEQSLQNRLRQMHPRALANGLFVIDARSSELQIGAVSGSIAARLKQLTPDMLSVLQHEGWQFTGIRVVVQVRPPLRISAKTRPKQIDTMAKESLARLESDLPDSPLRAAVSRLRRRI